MTNHLAQESSPYLLQHAENPVAWYPWSEAAFAKAKAEDKPIFLSIGYSTCHWCHVMEGDSFEKDDVAELLNRYYVSIKVDREERPDVDGFYMKAVQAMNQRGGWPLSVMLTPEGKPFWGGTFFPRPQFKAILQRIAEIWAEDRPVLEDNAFELTEHLRLSEDKLREEGKERPGPELLQLFVKEKKEQFDPSWGGFGKAPKFPPAMTLMALLRADDPSVLPIVTKTLDAMARGGMRDQVGGGFHRYSVDAEWLVPHFEKMLYDNALLALAYTEAYAFTQKVEYATVVSSTLDYVLRDMQNPDGGFYSAEDADSERTEGKFYVWTQAEIDASLSQEEKKIFQSFFRIEPNGNFEISSHVEELEAAAGLKAVRNANILHHNGKEQLPSGPAYEGLLQKLRQLRSQRVRPGLDDKILCAWNGLMIAALAKAGRILGRDDYRWAAAAASDFIQTKMVHEGRLLRSYRKGPGRYKAYLEDYAGLVFGLIELYEATLETRYLLQAMDWQERQNALFWDKNAFFEDDGSDARIPIRSKEWMDDATPSGNSLSAWNLLRLSALSGQDTWREMATAILEEAAGLMRRFPSAFPLMMIALDALSMKSLVIAGRKATAFSPQSIPGRSRRSWVRYDKALLERCPILEGRASADQDLIFYPCEQGSCRLPVAEIGEAFRD